MRDGDGGKPGIRTGEAQGGGLGEGGSDRKGGSGGEGDRGEGVSPGVAQRERGVRAIGGGRRGGEGSERRGAEGAGRRGAAAPAERKPRAPQRPRGADARRHAAPPPPEPRRPSNAHLEKPRRHPEPRRRSAPLPPGRLPGSQGDDVTRRGRRRRYGDAATHAPAVAAGPASRATMRKGAPSPRQRVPHARPEARAGLEGQREAKKSGGGTESPQGSPGELGERAGEGRAPLRSADGGWRLAAGLWAGRSAGSCSDTLGCGQNVGIRDGEDGGPDSALRAGLVGT